MVKENRLEKYQEVSALKGILVCQIVQLFRYCILTNWFCFEVMNETSEIYARAIG